MSLNLPFSVRLNLAWLGALLLPGTFCLAQLPTDNPYQTRYASPNHWSSSVRWHNVVNAREIDGLSSQLNEVDSARLHQTMQALSAKGGGVLYFPPGTYTLTYDLHVPDGVVVRGAAPRGEVNALSDRYRLATKFDFPTYPPPKDNAAAPITTAFKGIYAATARQRNFGLVNIDLNRAVIDFSAGLGTGSDAQSAAHQNVLLFGLRQNNAARPDPRIPTATQRQRNRGWQRWPLKEGANIRLSVTQNALIANCRLNDAPTDNFWQSGYLLDDGMILDGSQAVFNFTDHTGVIVSGNAVQLTDTYLAVAEGNEAVSDPSGRAMLSGNRIEPIKHTRWVKNGNEALQTHYDQLYRSDSLHEFHTYRLRGDSIRYCLIKPRHYNPNQKYPLIVFFHPELEVGNLTQQAMRDLVWYTATDEFRRNFPAFVLIPMLPANLSWVPKSRVRSIAWPITLSMNIVNQLEQRGTVDPNRIYVMGINWGGAATWDVLTRYPEKVAAAVPVSAFYEITPERAEDIKHIPIWVVSGEKDEAISPTLSQIMLANLRSGNVNMRHTNFENTGHRCWYRLTDNADLFNWLFAQHK